MAFDFAPLALGLAGWMRYACGVDEAGEAYEVQDPHAEALVARARPHLADPAALADALLGFEPVFGADAALREALRAPVTEVLASMTEHGVTEAIERL